MKYIWLFGENEGRTANNNSFYLWKHIVNNHSDLDVYFIMIKSDNNKKVYSNLDEIEKKYIIWRNSFKHIKLYNQADMLFVSLSFRDVQPDRILFKSYKPTTKQPLIYLQHGTLGIKQLEYKFMYSNNCMQRFVYYNPKIANKLCEVNGFKQYQLYNGLFHPRYCELVRRYKKVEQHQEKRILWFLTWREYCNNAQNAQELLETLHFILQNKVLLSYLDSTMSKLTICLHPKFNPEIVRKISEISPRVTVIYSNQADIMQELAENDVLITDYSSVAFDFTLLGKPVVLYLPDLDKYLKKRKLYCEIEELREASIQRIDDLIETIINEKYRINQFFRERMPEYIDLDSIQQGIYNEKMYQYFFDLQKKSIAFLGYDFSGIGGTVFATRALAEGLMEQGYSVRFYTLKRVNPGHYPAGVPIRPMCNRYQPSLLDKLTTSIVRSKSHFRYLKWDPAYKAMQPISGLGMTLLMKNIKAETVVSTRESLHFFLNEAKSPMINNKIYFFHTSSALVDELYPKCLIKINSFNLKKTVFVTERNRQELAEINGFTNYQQYLVLGNALDNTRMISRENINTVEDKQQLNLCYLLRISHERQPDLERMLSFVDYLKEKKLKNIHLDVYGSGDLSNWLKQQIGDRQIYDYISYRGATNNVKNVYNDHDAVVDFSYHQSFGMVYLESLFNGKMVFCYHNEGADDVLKDIPECFVNNNEEMVNKILSLPQITQETLISYYDIISTRFSRKSISQKFIDYVNYE